MVPLDFLIAVFLLLAGMCVGSFLNVVIWRLPNMMHGAIVTYAGKTGKLTLNWPPSHCPNCDSAIPWYLNVPVFGWFMLAGQCAKCRKPIAFRYPIVELATGLLFLATFLIYNNVKIAGSFDIGRDWPALGMHLLFISALLAAAAIDADTYYIPISLPVVMGILALITAPLTDSPLIPALAREHWHFAKPLVGAGIGLVIANILVWRKILPLSFAVPDEDEKGAGGKKDSEKKNKEKNPTVMTEKGTVEIHPATKNLTADILGKPQPADEEERIKPLPNTTKKLPTAITVILSLFTFGVAWLLLPAIWAGAVSITAGSLIFLVGVLSRDPDSHDATEEVMEEISAAGARREILKEILFLVFPIAGALISAIIPVALPHSDWLARLLAAVAGLIVGAGSIWLVRILGTLWKGIEAMGMGDVYLMAGIGAVLGPTAVLVCFPLLSAFLALGWAAIRYFTRGHTILPFGPWLAMAAIPALFFGQPIVNWYFNSFLMVPGLNGR
jgi:leader peptidase (prepilin peptidase)/N-methyltransferase